MPEGVEKTKKNFGKRIIGFEDDDWRFKIDFVCNVKYSINTNR